MHSGNDWSKLDGIFGSIHYYKWKLPIGIPSWRDVTDVHEQAFYAFAICGRNTPCKRVTAHAKLWMSGERLMTWAYCVAVNELTLKCASWCVEYQIGRGKGHFLRSRCSSLGITMLLVLTSSNNYRWVLFKPLTHKINGTDTSHIERRCLDYS